jgi:hypothetical protein
MPTIMVLGTSGLLLLLAICCAPGCRVDEYVVEKNVTVPPEVQGAFSAAAPGFVMSKDHLMGVLCGPRSESVVFHLRLVERYTTCEENRIHQDETGATAYAFRPAESELQRLDVRSRDILACGETAPVEDPAAVKDVFGLYKYNSVDPVRQIAVGSSKGECVSSSRYVVNIALALK